MKIIKNLLTISLVVILINGCTANKDVDKKEINNIVITNSTGNPLVDLVGAELSMYIIKSPAFQYLSDIAIRKNNDHLDSTDAILSSLKDPFFKFINKDRETWVYLDVYAGNNTGNLFFEIEKKKVLGLYSNFDDVPNYKEFKKHPTYIDPLKDIENTMIKLNFNN